MFVYLLANNIYMINFYLISFLIFTPFNFSS